ncbi:hypothetical protein HYW17_03590 [Candidatus Uhrbacteria bacterium]|nr:hypothetical protein [Candidatus Uhrbacteria bacterium]
MAIRDVILADDQLTFTYVNNADVPVGGSIRIALQWMTPDGIPVSPEYWTQVGALGPREARTFSAEGVTVISGSGNRQSYEKLQAFIHNRRANAEILHITIDQKNEIRESDEGNNVVKVLPVPAKPDLTIREAAFTAGRLTFAVVNLDKGIAKGPLSLWFEWVSADGERELGPFWYDASQDLPPARALKVDSANVRVWGVALRGSGRIEEHAAAAILASPPAGTVALKVWVDGPNRIAESNESNNSVTLTVPLPDLIVSDLAFTKGAITWKEKNLGDSVEGSFAYHTTVEWLDNQGKRISEWTIQSATAMIPAGRASPEELSERFGITTSFLTPPAGAAKLRVTADSKGTLTEKDEGNNAVEMVVSLPDLTVSDLALGDRAITWTLKNIGDTVSGNFRYSENIEWLDSDGKVMKKWTTDTTTPMLRAGSVSPRDIKAEYEIPLAFFIPPQGAVKLKVTVDPTNTVAEKEEGNNSVEIAIPLRNPDLTVTDLSLGNGIITWKLRNVGDTVSGTFKYLEHIEWVDREGKTVSKRIVDTTTSILYARETPRDFKTEYGIPASFFTPPTGAVNLRVWVDPTNTVPEQREDNNTVAIVVARPDLTVTDLKITKDAITWKEENVGDALEGGYTYVTRIEWLNKDGKTIHQQDPQTASSNTLRTGVVNYGELSGRFGTSPEFLTPPSSAVKLRVTVDAKGTVPEKDEGNNVLEIAVPTPPLPSKLPDLIITDATLDTAALRFWYHNRGETATASGVSFWYEWVDASGARVGELRWINVDAMSPKSKSQGNQLLDFADLTGERGKMIFREFVNTAPPSAIHLKLTIDGPNAHAEANEQNNSVLLLKSGAVVKLPDLALTGGSRAGGVVKVTIVNDTGNTLRTPLLQFKWLGANDAPLATSPVSYWSGTNIAPGKTGEFAIEYEKWREDGVTRFLKQPPAGAVALLATIDPENQLKEANEDNNAFRIGLGQPDLAYGKPEVRDNALIIPVTNHGVSASVATDIWLQWYGAGKWLPGSGAVDVPAVSAGATVEIAVPLNRSFGPDGRILADLPPTAERLRLFLDGSRKVDESNEQNNTIMLDRAALVKVAEAPALPDIAFTTIFVPPGSDRLIIGFQNSGKAELSAWEWQVHWLDGKGNPISETYRNTQSGLKPQWRYGVGSDSQDLTGKPRPLGEFLRQIPADAVRIEITLDPENQVAESDEKNNVGRFEVEDFPPSLRLPQSAPELKLTLLAEIVKAKSAAAASPLATAGFVMALAALLSGAYMVHAHTGVRRGPAGFLEVFPLLFAPARDSYMFLRQCGPEGCAGSHFARHKMLKGLTRTSLAVSGFTGLTKVILAIAFAVLAPSSAELLAQNITVHPGDEIRATLTAKNTGKVKVGNIVLTLPCPEGSAWKSATLNDKSLAQNPAQDLAVNYLEPGAAHRLSIICEIENSARALGQVSITGRAKAAGISQPITSNTVTLRIADLPKKEPEALQEKPDLTVEGLGFLPLTDIVEKDRAPFEAIFSGIVSNKGKQASGAFRSRVRVDHGSNGTWDAVSPALVETPALAAGKDVLVKLPLEWKAPVGIYTFEICIDPGRNIDESDETNNCATDRFTLKVGEEPAQEEELVE